ncbi:MAG TPA: EamA family transporter [Blastocatellia bacterium]|nr:EamA family transporter [Blastocatellia bacterium]
MGAAQGGDGDIVVPQFVQVKGLAMDARIIVFAILSLIWGSTWIFIKLGLRDLPPATFAGARFLIATVLLWLIVIWRRARLPQRRGEWGLILLTGLFGIALNYGLLFWGEQHISSGLAAVIQAIIPAFGLLIAHFQLPDEKITLVKLTGLSIGIGGVALIFSNQIRVEGKMALAGSAAILFGAFFVAFCNVMARAHGSNIDPATFAAGQTSVGLVPLLAYGAAYEGNPFSFHWSPLALGSLLYLALFGSTLAFIMLYWLIKRMEATKVMLISLITPGIAVTIGMLTLNEKLTWRIAAGGAAILVGVALTLAEKLKMNFASAASRA